MPMNDGSAPDHPLPLFLADRADVVVQSDSSRILKTALVVLTVSAIGAAVFAFGDPVTRLAALTASLVDVSAPQPDNRQPAPTVQSAADIQASPTTQQASPAIQSTADVQAPPATAPDASTRQETRQEAHQEIGQSTRQGGQEARQDVAAAPQPAAPQTETSEPSSDALFRQFQAWSREQDSRQSAQARVAPTQPAEPTQRAQSGQAESAKDAPTKVEPDVRAPVRTAKKHRRARALQNARAEMRSVRNSRAKSSRERSAQVRARRIEDARAQSVPAQNPQPPQAAQPPQPSALSQIFGWQ